MLGSLLNSSSTSDLTRQQSASSAIVGRETSMYDDLEAAEVLLQVREDEVEEAKDRVAEERAAAAAQLARISSLTAQAVAARDDVRGLVAKRFDAQQAANRAQQADRAALAALRKQEARIKARIAAAAPPGAWHTVSARTDRLPAAAGLGAGHLAVRLPDPPDLRLLGRCTTAPTSASPAASRWWPPAPAP